MRIHVEFTQEIPDGLATQEEFHHWLRFELHEHGEIQTSNPLLDDCQIEPEGLSLNWRVISGEFAPSLPAPAEQEGKP